MVRRFSCLGFLLVGACGGGLPSDNCAETSANQVAVSPKSLSLALGASATLTAVVTDKCGQSVAGQTVSWASRNKEIALITSTGALTALVTALDTGTVNVLGSVATLTDSGVVAVADTVTLPPPPPPIQATYFRADGESGNLDAWSQPWGAPAAQFNGTVSTSTAHAKSGSWAYEFEVTRSCQPCSDAVGHDARVMRGDPAISMGSPNGRFLTGYYSFWAYVDAGYNQPSDTGPAWNLLLGWMTGVTGAPSPISHIGLEVWNGVLQVVYVLKNCSTGLYTCPAIPGYAQTGGWYRMTSSSPAGIRPFPRGRWVHLAVYYGMAANNGQVTAWQDGVKIMDLTAPTMNTFGGHSIDPLGNKAGDMMLQFGIYGGRQTGTQRLYIDDFTVTDQRPVP